MEIKHSYVPVCPSVVGRSDGLSVTISYLTLMLLSENLFYLDSAKIWNIVYFEINLNGCKSIKAGKRAGTYQAMWRGDEGGGG